MSAPAQLAPVVILEREEFLRMYRNGVTMRAMSYALGMNEEEMALALLEAQYNKHQRLKDEQDKVRREKTAAALERALAAAAPVSREPNKVFCGQCDRLVLPAEFMNCRSAFCKAKAAA